MYVRKSGMCKPLSLLYTLGMCLGSSSCEVISQIFSMHMYVYTYVYVCTHALYLSTLLPRTHAQGVKQLVCLLLPQKLLDLNI